MRILEKNKKMQKNKMKIAGLVLAAIIIVALVGSNAALNTGRVSRFAKKSPGPKAMKLPTTIEGTIGTTEYETEWANQIRTPPDILPCVDGQYEVLGESGWSAPTR